MLMTLPTPNPGEPLFHFRVLPLRSRPLSTDQRQDGSVTLHISAQSPGPGEESNWLPAPKGPFYLVLRLYLPKAPGATKVRARRRVPPSAQLASRFRTIDSDYVR